MKKRRLRKSDCHLQTAFRSCSKNRRAAPFAAHRPSGSIRGRPRLGQSDPSGDHSLAGSADPRFRDGPDPQDAFVDGERCTVLSRLKKCRRGFGNSEFRVPSSKFSPAQRLRQVRAAQYPQFRIPEGYERLIEPEAGFITPERAVLLYTERAIQNGANVHTKEKTLEWKKSGNTITVKTDKNAYQCNKLIITAGPWAGKVIPNLSEKLKVTRQMIAWVKPKRWRSFELGSFPCWTIADETKPGIFYGFPILSAGKFGGPIGLKLAHHTHGAVSDPDNINRNPAPEDESDLIYALNKFIPEGYESTHVMKTCMYTNTPDENFILDYVPGYEKDVVVAAGFSGHGFKFASVVGEIMADLATKGKTDHPIGFLKAKRF